MNANELADEVVSINDAIESEYNRFKELDEAATMLRQQQAEIESMQERMIVAEKELNHMRSFFGCDPAYYGMTPAEPVAWLHIQGNHFEASDRQLFDDEIERGWEQKPLYTHPAKTLTDEETLELTNDSTIFEYREFNDDMVRFARAILRKAQEHE
jgi:hypothetical protein